MITLKITWRYCLAFYFVVMLYASLHELVHHFAAYVICGEWGYKTFNYFRAACDSNEAWYATYAGPVFSYIMMYVGAFYLLKQDPDYKRYLGFALVFAQLPLQRMLMPFFKMNDEYAATANMFGESLLNYWLVIVVVWLICLPPLLKAYSSIKNRNKMIWFLFYLVLFPYLLFGPVFGILEYLMVEKDFLATPVIGIGLLFIINEILTIIGFYFTKRNLNPFYKSPAVNTVIQNTIS